MLFPTSEPPPSGPWHIAHFVRKVALLAAPSGPGLARTETTKSVRPTKSSSRIADPKITWCSALSCVMAFPLLAIFHSRYGYFPIQRRRGRQLKPSVETNRPHPEPRFRIQLPHRSKARVVPFLEGSRMFVQDIGSKEDTELNGQGLTLSWRELSVETPGHCQSVGNWTFFPEWCAGKAANTPRLRGALLSILRNVEQLTKTLIRVRIEEWRNSKVASPCQTSSPDRICPISESHPRAAACEHLPISPQTAEQMPARHV